MPPAPLHTVRGAFYYAWVSNPTQIRLAMLVEPVVTLITAVKINIMNSQPSD